MERKELVKTFGERAVAAVDRLEHRKLEEDDLKKFAKRVTKRNMATLAENMGLKKFAHHLRRGVFGKVKWQKKSADEGHKNAITAINGEDRKQLIKFVTELDKMAMYSMKRYAGTKRNTYIYHGIIGQQGLAINAIRESNHKEIVKSEARNLPK